MLLERGVDGVANLVDALAGDDDVAEQRISDRAVDADRERPAETRIAVNGHAENVAPRDVIALLLRRRRRKGRSEDDKAEQCPPQGAADVPARRI